MKTVLNIIIAFLTIVILWKVEVATQVPASESSIWEVAMVIPFLLVAIYARFHINEIENL